MSNTAYEMTAPMGFLTLQDAVQATRFAFPLESSGKHYNPISPQGMQNLSVVSFGREVPFSATSTQPSEPAMDIPKTIFMCLLMFGKLTSFQGERLRQISAAYWQSADGSTSLESGIKSGEPIYCNAAQIEEFVYHLTKLQNEQQLKTETVETVIPQEPNYVEANDQALQKKGQKFHAALTAIKTLFPTVSVALTKEMKRDICDFVSKNKNTTGVSSVGDTTIRDAFNYYREEMKKDAEPETVRFGSI